MQVFITGASGHIGSALIPELLGAGHEVIGLARSDAAAEAVEKRGAKVQRGSLDDLDVLRDAGRASDGVIHLAFNHDFSKFAANCEADRLAIETLGAALACPAMAQPADSTSTNAPPDGPPPGEHHHDSNAGADRQHQWAHD